MSRFSAARLLNSPVFRCVLTGAEFLHQWTLWAVLLAPLGCVVPLAPEFQDPPAASNTPPRFLSSDPAFEVQRNAPQDFAVKVEDVNPRDRLYVRWASDYPSFEQSSSRLLADIETTAGNLPLFRVPAKCDDFAMTDSKMHRLVVIVSDQPFVKDPSKTNNPDYRYSATVNSSVPIMAGWVVVCP